jgi:hypothetical protein
MTSITQDLKDSLFQKSLKGKVISNGILIVWMHLNFKK